MYIVYLSRPNRVKNNPVNSGASLALSARSTLLQSGSISWALASFREAVCDDFKPVEDERYMLSQVHFIVMQAVVGRPVNNSR